MRNITLGSFTKPQQVGQLFFELPNKDAKLKAETAIQNKTNDVQAFLKQKNEIRKIRPGIGM